MNRQFLEYYRCPEDRARFRLEGELLPQPGFFRVGPDLTCYGRTTRGKTQQEATETLADVLAGVRVERGACTLPFNLDEVVENLRMERYNGAMPAVVRDSAKKAITRKAYYAVRPLLPTPLRKHVQRIALRGWDRAQFPRWPIDQTVDQLFDRMMACAVRANSGEPVPFIWFWPDGYASCAIMTHDVETAVGRDFCANLMDLDDSYGIKASFQLIPEVRYEVADEFVQDLRKRGFEINVHDFNHDGALFHNREEFLYRVARINDYGKKFQAAGYRSGVLYRNLDWYDFFEYAYDMSVPNVGHLDPQRGGCCTTKPYFIGRILEIPVVATQDYTLFNILGQYSMALWEQQFELVLEQNGMISFIVHPDYLLEKRARNVYSELLGRMAELRQRKKLWIPLPKELNDWWRSRNEMRLVREGDWRIEGPDKRRARIAYAKLEGDRLVYSFEQTLHMPVHQPPVPGSQPSVSV